MFSRPLIRALSCLLLSAGLAGAARPPHHPTGRTPAATTEVRSDAFRSAIVVDATTGRILFEDKADVQNPPASVTKLMTFLIVAEKIKQGELKPDTPVTVTAEAARTGGSQVFLVDKEQITVDEMLYALMVQSANDAATALAIQVAGSKEAFVELMNAKAQELGMTHTVFQSPHGLPPGRGQEADLSTARDLSILARRLLAETDILRYSSTRDHQFRHQNGKVMQLSNHNHLLRLLPGCDGLKTGWYQKAGYSLVATVQRNGRRIIAVILGSPERKLRDITTTRLIARGFTALGPAAATAGPAPATQNPGAGPVPLPTRGTGGPQPQPVTGTSAGPTPMPASGESAPGIRAVPLRPEDMLPADDENPAPEVHIDTSGAKH